VKRVFVKKAITICAWCVTRATGTQQIFSGAEHGERSNAPSPQPWIVILPRQVVIADGGRFPLRNDTTSGLNDLTHLRKSASSSLRSLCRKSTQLMARISSGCRSSSRRSAARRAGKEERRSGWKPNGRLSEAANARSRSPVRRSTSGSAPWTRRAVAEVAVRHGWRQRRRDRDRGTETCSLTSSLFPGEGRNGTSDSLSRVICGPMPNKE
jgi:hypothetical protein